MYMDINFVIVNYENCKLTIDCIKSILEQSDNCRIIVVDNNSTKKDLDPLIRYSQINNEHVRILFLHENIGYFPAINQGIKYLGKFVKSNHTIICNNDLIFLPNFIKTLSSVKINQKTQAIAPDIVKSNGVHQNPFLIYRYSAIRKFVYKIFYSNYIFAKMILRITRIFSINRSEKSRDGFDNQQIIRAPHGACIILTTNFFNNNSLLNDESFLFGEEILLAGQIKQSEGEILYIPALKVVHNEHSTIGEILSKTNFKYKQKGYRASRKYM